MRTAPTNRSDARAPSRLTQLTIASLLTAFVLQAAFAAVDDSVTVDEFVHLPVGLYMLRHLDFTPDPINPPLSRILPALAVVSSPSVIEPPFDANPWGMGLAFLDRNFDGYQQTFVRARCIVIVLAALIGIVVYRWTLDLYGQVAALTALFLFAFSPSLLAHGHLVTVDVAGALGFLATLRAWWGHLRRPSIGRAALVGLLFGAAVLAKLSGLLLVVVIGASAFIEIAAPDEAGRRLRLATSLFGSLVIVGAVAVVVVGAGYGFSDIAKPLASVPFRGGGPLAAIAAAFPALRVPLPATFLEGADLAMTGRDSERAAYYLAGSFSASGWWYYHFVAFALKTPLPVVLASIAALASWLVGRRRGQRQYCLFVAVMVIFVVNGVLNPLNIGARHVLAAEPLLLILVAPVLAAPLVALRRVRDSSPMAIAAAACSILALLWTAAGTLRGSPRYIQYFNEAAGGPDEGHRWLIDSNLDWGQDLIRLSRYMREHGLASVHLAYMGTVHPWVYGVQFSPLTRESRGIAVISASTLMGSSYAVWSDSSTHVKPEPGTFDWLRRLPPEGRVGSLFVFDLP